MKTLRIAVIQKLNKQSEDLVCKASKASCVIQRQALLKQATKAEFKANMIATKYKLTDFLFASKEMYHE